ncbi:MAG: hypothetical protein U0263_05955 [Polyangiaceae bacterium]
MRAPSHLVLLAAGLALSPRLARAEDSPKPFPPCEKTPTEGEVAGAKGAFQAGQASFEEADYNRAISYWEDAYRRDCTAHALLLNLARAYELNNQKRHAVVALETYLGRQPSSPQRDQIARRIEVLNEKLAQESTSAPAKTGPETGAPTKPTGPTPTPEPDRGGQRPLVPLIVAGAGGVLTIVGSVLYFKASSDVKDVEDQCGGRDCPPGLAKEGNDARSRQTLWGGVAIGGLVVAAGGLTWYFLSEPAPAKSARALRPSPRPRVDPVVGRGFTGLALSGSF